MKSDPVLSLSNVTLTFKGKRNSKSVLSNVTLDIERGDHISIVGANGSGKTTLIKVMLGIEAPTTGAVRVPIADGGRRLSYMPQDYRNGLFPWLRIGRNIQLLQHGDVQPRDTVADFNTGGHRTVDDLARRFRLSIDQRKYPYQLSGGEQQMLLLIALLLRRPDVLILDEPLSAVDFGRKRLIIAHLGDVMHAAGVTSVVSTHDFEDAVLLADRVVVLSGDTVGQTSVKKIIDVPLKWPRTQSMRHSEQCRKIVDQIAAEME